MTADRAERFRETADHVRCEFCSPELTARDFEEMLAELDAICHQARELSTQIRLQMVERQTRNHHVVTIRQFPRPVDLNPAI